jgi:DNA-directed RNA polymerase specialized sigma24 family protein
VGAPEQEVEDWSHYPGRTVEQRQRARLVQNILERMPRDQVEVLLLVKVEGHTLPETAALVGVPLGTATSRLRLAIARFTKLAKQLGLEPDLSPLSEPEVASR